VLITLAAGALLFATTVWFIATLLIVGIGIRASGLPRIVHDQLKSLTAGVKGGIQAAAPDLLVPVMGVGPEELVDSFDESRSHARNHDAIDILAPRHTPVVAADDGTIAKLLSSRLGGITIVQYDPERSRVYTYAHLDRYAPRLEEGATVSRGQLLGFVGTSGNATTPHLHFAVHQLDRDSSWWEGTPVSPHPLFQGNSREGRSDVEF
jgi:murein DD-endopeptidase MepM/ murein hydrolase activator NlpD